MLYQVFLDQNVNEESSIRLEIVRRLVLLGRAVSLHPSITLQFFRRPSYGFLPDLRSDGPENVVRKPENRPVVQDLCIFSVRRYRIHSLSVGDRGEWSISLCTCGASHVTSGRSRCRCTSHTHKYGLRSGNHVIVCLKTSISLKILHISCGGHSCGNDCGVVGKEEIINIFAMHWVDLYLSLLFPEQLARTYIGMVESADKKVFL